MSARPTLGAVSALRRSFNVYYRDRARTERMDRLNAQFVRPGSLAFDIGAHVGDRTGSFLRLGAKVVALEPQPHVFRALRLIYGRSENVTLVAAAAGAEAGSLTLHINTANPTVSTASRDLIAAANTTKGWMEQTWDHIVDVPVITLDLLIAAHGVPDFVKIDVEGHELAVLEGLGTALPALAFEFTTIQRAVALRCVDRLTALGGYRFNLSFGEDHSLHCDAWLDAPAITKALKAIPTAANSGDIFARLESSKA